MPTSKRQRCIKHKLDNVVGYIPEKKHDQIQPESKSIFYQENQEKADQAIAAFCLKNEKSYLSAFESLIHDGDACLTFYAFPERHRKFIRTTNIIERLFGEVK